jgi:hypothetical protein
MQMTIETKEMSTPEITLELSHFLNNSVKMLIAQGQIGKVSDFASRCDISENVMVNILNHRTAPSYGQFLSMIAVIRELSPEYSYKYLKQQLLGEF